MTQADERLCVMNLSELHKLPDLLLVQRTVLSVVLADEVLEDTHSISLVQGEHGPV